MENNTAKILEVEEVNSTSSNSQSISSETKFKVLSSVLNSTNPSCILPQEYLENSATDTTKKKKMISIRKWDGTEIFSLERD